MLQEEASTKRPTPAFLASVASLVVLLLGFLLWWLLDRRLSWADRLYGFGAAVVGGVLAALLSSKTIGMIAWLLMSLPIVLTAWTAWLLLTRKAAARTRRIGLFAVLFLSWGAFTLIRMEGVKGDGQSELHWRLRRDVLPRFVGREAAGGFRLF